MSVYAFEVGSFTPGVGAADNVTETGTIMGLLGGSGTQMNFVEEIYLGGLAASTAPMIMMLARNSTIGATPTALAANSGNSAGPVHPSASATTAVTYIAATTLPTRSGSIALGRKTFAFNAYGGMVRCNYANTQDRFGTLGNTASLGEFSLSSFTGSTAASAISGHILYEQL
jgi:hypothetical protein